MQKLLGVELEKVIHIFKVSLTTNEMQVWLCWTIFAIKIVCAPLNLIFGGVFFNESSEEEQLPALMVTGGLLEVGSHQYAPGTHIFSIMPILVAI